MQQDAQAKEAKKKRRLRSLREWLVAFLIALVAVFLLMRFVIVNAQIPSGSMEPTILAGDRIFGLRLAYAFSTPQREDIVIFEYPDDESQLFVKRIIGLPGEVVEIKNGQVYIDGALTTMAQEYVNGVPVGDFGPYEVPEGCYFVMGDNRNQSWDSRYWDNTFVREDAILAKAVWRIFPNMGKLE